MSEGLTVVKVRRGGEATLHSPGQLVIYPVIQLKSVGLRVKDFIVALQSITQLFLRDLGIETKKGENFAGLYTKPGEIGFLWYSYFKRSEPKRLIFECNQ